jgi:hypothetical protein
LRRKGSPEDILELSAECLSVLNIETEMQTFLRVLGAVGEETMTKLSDKLKHLVGEEDLITWMRRSTEELPTLALCLAKLFMLEPLSERTFEEAFSCFTEQLSQAALSAGTIDLAEQVSDRLNSTQLAQMNQALKTQPREEEVELRLKRLRLKEAYLRLREGDTETAVRLVNTLQDTLEAFYQVPTFIYSYKQGTDQLQRISLVTGEHSSHRVPSYTFKFGCCWSEVPGGSLLITGGGYPDEVRELVRIDTCREFAVTHCAPMLTPRRQHAAVYHTPHLYVLGGWNESRALSSVRGTFVQRIDGKLCLLSLELAPKRVE